MQEKGEGGKEKDYYFAGCVHLMAHVLYEKYKDNNDLEKIRLLKEWAYKRALPAARALDAKRGFNEIGSKIVDEVPTERCSDDSEYNWERGGTCFSEPVQTPMPLYTAEFTSRQSSNRQNDRTQSSQKIAA